MYLLYNKEKTLKELSKTKSYIIPSNLPGLRQTHLLSVLHVSELKDFIFPSNFLVTQPMLCHARCYNAFDASFDFGVRVVSVLKVGEFRSVIIFRGTKHI